MSALNPALFGRTLSARMSLYTATARSAFLPPKPPGRNPSLSAAASVASSGATPASRIRQYVATHASWSPALACADISAVHARTPGSTPPRSRIASNVATAPSASPARADAANAEVHARAPGAGAKPRADASRISRNTRSAASAGSSSEAAEGSSSNASSGAEEEEEEEEKDEEEAFETRGGGRKEVSSAASCSNPGETPPKDTASPRVEALARRASETFAGLAASAYAAMTVLYVASFGRTPAASMSQRISSARRGAPARANAAATRLNAIGSGARGAASRPRPARFPPGSADQGPARAPRKGGLYPGAAKGGFRREEALWLAPELWYASTASSKSAAASSGSSSAQCALIAAVHARGVGSHPETTTPSDPTSQIGEGGGGAGLEPPSSASSSAALRAVSRASSSAVRARRFAFQCAMAPRASPARSYASRVSSRSLGSAAHLAHRSRARASDATSGKPPAAATWSVARIASAARSPRPSAIAVAIPREGVAVASRSLRTRRALP